jgi:hypothetical protein
MPFRSNPVDKAPFIKKSSRAAARVSAEEIPFLSSAFGARVMAFGLDIFISSSC